MSREPYSNNLDLLRFPTMFLFYESGYSIERLRQASRRSWRIGQKQPVRVKYMAYAGTMQENCLRLMGKKLLVSLAMEGKFANHGLQALDDDDECSPRMARELVMQKASVKRQMHAGARFSANILVFWNRNGPQWRVPRSPRNGKNGRNRRSPSAAPMLSSSWVRRPRRLVEDLVMTERHSSRLVSERTKQYESRRVSGMSTALKSITTDLARGLSIFEIDESLSGAR